MWRTGGPFKASPKKIQFVRKSLVLIAHLTESYHRSWVSLALTAVMLPDEKRKKGN